MSELFMPALAEMQPLAETEQERISRFEERLTQVATAKTIELAVNIHDDPIRTGVNQVQAESGGEGSTLLVHPDFAHLTEGKVAFTGFRTRTGKRSAHGVFFGRLNTEDGQQVQVAVKPHNVDAPSSSATDYVTNAVVEKIGMYNLKPVGTIIDMTDQDMAYSISELDRTITTLDSVDWRYMRSRNEQAYRGIWSQVARQAALIHSMGSVAHGDLAARNIALKEDGGVFPMDWERASISLHAPRDPEARYALSRPDMGELMESMVRPARHPYKAGLEMFGTDVNDQWQGFNDLVFNEYAATRLDFANKRGERFDVEDELLELGNALRSHLRVIQ